MLDTDPETFLGAVTSPEAWEGVFRQNRARLEGSEESFRRLDELYDLSDLGAAFSD